MTRALVDAQLKWRDAELSSRLWKDVADRGMDRGRLLHLIYSVDAHHDDVPCRTPIRPICSWLIPAIPEAELL